MQNLVYLKVECLPQPEAKAAIRELQALSNRTGVKTYATVSGIHVVAAPGNDANDLIDAFEQPVDGCASINLSKAWA